MKKKWIKITLRLKPLEAERINTTAEQCGFKSGYTLMRNLFDAFFTMLAEKDNINPDKSQDIAMAEMFAGYERKKTRPKRKKIKTL